MSNLKCNFFVSARMSKKGSRYVALFCDMGYREYCVSFDSSFIGDLLSMTPSQLSELAINERIPVAVK